MNEHLFPLKVYFEDTDSGGIVHHPNYLKYFERARIELWNELGFSLTRLKEDFNVHFVIREVNIKYKKPAYLEQQLVVVSKVTKVSRVKMVFHQTVYSNWYEDKISLCTAEIEVVCINLQNKIAPLPDILLKELNRAS